MLKHEKIVIATHVLATGPPQDLEEYLVKSKIKELLFIGHPLFYQKNQDGSGYRIYEKGNLIKEKCLRNKNYKLREK